MNPGNIKPSRSEINLLSKCAAPMLWGDGKGRFSGGTVTFFGGISPIAITNYHVLKAFRGYLKNRGGQVVIRDLPFDIESRLIDENSTLDLATFKITNKELLQIHKVPAYQTTPYSLPKAGDGAFLVGYPGKYRITDKADYPGSLSVQLSGFEVSQVGTLTILVSRKVSKQALIEEIKAKYTSLKRLGGLSGCPVLGLATTKASGSMGIPTLLGITHADSNLLDSWVVRPITCISMDGKIQSP